MEGPHRTSAKRSPDQNSPWRLADSKCDQSFETTAVRNSECGACLDFHEAFHGLVPLHEVDALGHRHTEVELVVVRIVDCYEAKDNSEGEYKS